MFETTCLDSENNVIEYLTQWDTNQKLVINNFQYKTAPIFNFCNKKSTQALCVQSNILDTKITVDIPNILLTEPYTIISYICVQDEHSSKTVDVIKIPVRSRVKPSDFEYKDNVNVIHVEGIIKQVEDILKQVEKTESLYNAAVENNNKTIDKVENLAEVYNSVKSDMQETKKQADSVTQQLNFVKQQAEKIFNEVFDIYIYLGLTDNNNNVLGLQVDYKNKTFKRLAGATNLKAGKDFDKFNMYGGRKRCNVLDNGTITAYYGDENYKEDGTNGQVMVYQPKFYYRIVPLVTEPIENGKGFHLRCANYYVADKPYSGFKVHPAFLDSVGNECDYILDGAYEGSMYDKSTYKYLLNDEQTMNVKGDMLSSIAGAHPASGATQQLTRENIEKLAQNRGTNWHCDTIQIESMTQLLMMIEMGTMNMQSAIGEGITGYAYTTDADSTNWSSITGSTASLGNSTGRAAETFNSKSGKIVKETENNKVAITWRGKENPWGNLNEFVTGINIWGDGTMCGGQPYISYCFYDDFNSVKHANSYHPVGFTLPNNKQGYVSAMGYGNPNYDWLFLPSELKGDSTLPVGDNIWITQNVNDCRIVVYGGYSFNYTDAGLFCYNFSFSPNFHNANTGGRLVYVPNPANKV